MLSASITYMIAVDRQGSSRVCSSPRGVCKGEAILFDVGLVLLSFMNFAIDTGTWR